MMDNHDMSVARAMIDAGIQAVSHINDAVDWEEADLEDFELHAHHTIH